MEVSGVVVRSAWLLIFAGFCFSGSSSPHKRFEYKLSFKGPHLVQKDGTIPFWEHGGHAIASDESIRITPSLRSKKGHVWSKVKSSLKHWEIEVSFRVSGRGRIGADGLAIWYTAEKGTDGPVFGSSDKWNGLGVIFDSFDNDGQHNNPYVMAMVNDGTQQYDHNSDGSSQQLGGCLRDFRNKPFPVRARIEYYQNALTVFIHNGMTNNIDDYELCLRAENVYLPAEGYFGVSAATGGLADDHDVTSFLTHSLTPPVDDSSKRGPEVSEDEKKKFEQEFDEYYQKLQKAKEDYQKEHPDKKPETDYDDDEKWFESQDERQLKQIFDGQNAIHMTVRDLHRRLDEVIGRQERTLSQIAVMSQGGMPPVQQGHGQGLPPPQMLPMDSIKRHEVDAIINNQREIITSLRDFRNTLDRQGQANPGYQGEQINSELKGTLNTIQNDVRILVNKPQNAPLCPQPNSNCVTPAYMFLFVIINAAMLIAYAVYRSNREAQAKKFY